ncbi:MAG: twin-arginine translocation signal domain-containing protein [Epsilonproteobacteria bacterium]|nr:twin-arginine translocation signal domain-containing protein [Campylobacterota bacterium]OIO15663.1 MAG: C4-dicarboxylate ABC transporter [Helicobacteraceae bacterium CG1_02_36_14]PIP11395.1 MAG: C4-dicarboxylate ABC transporter [Sulfurimonas sp. CG23_combo_of_CG06-09_8_20_14_all_36_33]PIS23797.1 MAG: C4-dicarboxylate ABC transporter [Sulfurimonas sp. CG08_land_8_20_14_0_20_36_33]PIU34773.1 MAG: C4-dicarboxylate ABC transporter [Sulfurimonas sp. CG07_land_8_20_14_0_80_36_56]PIV05820.1 MAG: 
MNRRNFLTTATAASIAAALSGCNESNRQAIDDSKRHELKSADPKRVNINKNRKTVLKLATSWPAHFPIMGTGVEKFVQRVKDISSGSLEIKLYPKNTLVPALAVFDACSSGQIDAFHSGPYYWKGKNSAFALYSGTPFGFTAEEINSWMLFGGGLELWREQYAKYNLYPFMGGNTNIQMGGWFRKPINSLEDMKGLKMRMPGLGGEVFSKMGVNPILLPAGEIYTALERGVIDATEWVGPALDIKMGFYKVAPYYYSGWHEPGSILEVTFNKYSFEKLSFEHQAIIEVASSEMNSNMTSEFHAENIYALKKLKELDIQILQYPKDVINEGKKALNEVIQELSAKNSDFEKVYASMEAHLKLSKEWSDVSLNYFLNER